MRNPVNKSIKTVFFALICAAFSFTFLSGCGVKGNPVPRGLVVPPAVGDLNVRAEAEGNRLTWSIPGDRPEAFKVLISRSELVIAEESCPGCPRKFVPIAEPAAKNLVRNETGETQYIDNRVRAGVLYTYTVKLCDESGFCGPESNKAEIKLK